MLPLLLFGAFSVSVERSSHDRSDAVLPSADRSCAHGPPYPNCSSAALPRQAEFSVSILDRDPAPDGGALISHANGSSSFNFAFTTAWFPAPEGSGKKDGLVVRVVECNANHHKCVNMTHPEWTNAGALTVIEADLAAEHVSTARITESSVFWAGVPAPARTSASRGAWGAADPRMRYRPEDQQYYLVWDNCTMNCYPHRTSMLSTTKDPFDPDGWTWHGPLLPGLYTAGASLLFRDDSPGSKHLAFVGNSDTAAAVLLAESSDGLSWNLTDSTWMTGRPGCWDACGVAPGGQPERLSSGDFLFVYNIDTGFPYKPSPLGRCAIGWAILDKDDPTQVVARSSEPLITAVLPWETCGGESGKGYDCQEPLVAFTTGMKPLGNDTFLILYGAADTDVGVTTIKVDVKPAPR